MVGERIISETRRRTRFGDVVVEREIDITGEMEGMAVGSVKDPVDLNNPQTKVGVVLAEVAKHKGVVNIGNIQSDRPVIVKTTEFIREEPR